MDFIIDKIKSIYWLTLGLIIRQFSIINKGQILFSSYYGKNFSCNPKALTEYILSNCPKDFSVCWMLNESADSSTIPQGVKIVRPNTIEYLRFLYTSEFIITNVRQFVLRSYWIKKKGQKYIMTWHSSVGLKCIEGDASLDSLGKSYVRAAKFDSKQCDLILSGSSFRSKIVKRAFWYTGEILEKGTPRNDVFFSDALLSIARKKVNEYFRIPENSNIILYAPTFRKSGTLEFYKVDWDRILQIAKSNFSANTYVLIRLHPNLIKGDLNTSCLTSYSNTIDATFYPDMHELLCASDVLITDYSSSMFDFPLTRKPVFLFAKDFSQYDRGVYFNFNELPFDFADSDEKLAYILSAFDLKTYQTRVESFMKDRIGSFESGHSCYSTIEWMNSHRL